MTISGALLLGFAPSLLWLWRLRKEDGLDPEPRMCVALLFLLGAASTALVLWLRPFGETLLPAGPSVAHDAADAFLLTAPLEELVKLLALWIGIRRLRAFDEPLDGIVYGGAVGLGFASVENALYVLQSSAAELALARAFTSTLLHTVCTASIGFLIGVARFARPGLGRWIGLGVVATVCAHATYNLLLATEVGLGWVSLVCLLPLFLVVLACEVRVARALSPLGSPARAVEEPDAAAAPATVEPPPTSR